MIWAGRCKRGAKTKKKNGKLARFSTFFFGWKCSFALPHYSITFFPLTKSFGCQRKSFRYWTKENFDTCLKSAGLVFTIVSLCPENRDFVPNSGKLRKQPDKCPEKSGFQSWTSYTCLLVKQTNRPYFQWRTGVLTKLVSVRSLTPLINTIIFQIFSEVQVD